MQPNNPKIFEIGAKLVAKLLLCKHQRRVELPLFVSLLKKAAEMMTQAPKLQMKKAFEDFNPVLSKLRADARYQGDTVALVCEYSSYGHHMTGVSSLHAGPGRSL